MSRRYTWCGLFVAGVLLGGCTLVPNDVAPRVVPARDVPSGLLTGRPIDRVAPVTLTYLTSANHPVARTSPHDAPVTVRVVIGALSVAPARLRTAVPTSLSVLRAIVHGNRCEISVANGLSTLPPSQRELALLQIGSSLQKLFGTSRVLLTDATSGLTYRWVGDSGR